MAKCDFMLCDTEVSKITKFHLATIVLANWLIRIDYFEAWIGKLTLKEWPVIGKLAQMGALLMAWYFGGQM